MAKSKIFRDIVKGAKQMAGAGDMSDAPRYQKGRKAGADIDSGISPKESAKLARKKQQIARAGVRAKGGKTALQIEWDDLLPKFKREEKKKFREGKKTPFASIIKEEQPKKRKPVQKVSQKEANEAAMKEAEKALGLKEGGKITYRMTGGQVVSHGYD